MAVLIIGGILAIVLFAICIIWKFVRLAIGIAILSIIIPILFTIFWGDGSAYISELASYLTPNHQQQLEDAYAYYKDQDSKDPIHQLMMPSLIKSPTSLIPLRKQRRR